MTIQRYKKFKIDKDNSINEGGQQVSSRRRMKRPKKKRLEKKIEIQKTVRENIEEGEILKQVKKEIKSFKYLTPYIISNKHNIKLSQSKKVLRKMEEEKIIKLIANSRRAPLYAINR